MQRDIERRPGGALLALVAISAIAYAALAGAVTAAPTAPPVNTQEPSITGNARVGEVLQGDRGDWQNAQEFCKKLSALPTEKNAGRVYRLATETSPLIKQVRDNVIVSITPQPDPEGPDPAAKAVADDRRGDAAQRLDQLRVGSDLAFVDREASGPAGRRGPHSTTATASGGM